MAKIRKEERGGSGKNRMLEIFRAKIEGGENSRSRRDEQKGTKASARSRPWKDVKSCSIGAERVRDNIARRATNPPRVHIVLVTPRYFSNRAKRLMNFTLFLVDDDFDWRGASKVGESAIGSNIETAWWRIPIRITSAFIEGFQLIWNNLTEYTS